MAILRIFFIGLIAFVPSSGDKEMAVLLVNARDGYALSDGEWMEPHKPLLLVKADRCVGDCTEQSGNQQTIADFLYPYAAEKDPSAALRILQNAISGGGAWELGLSDLSIQIGTGERLASRTGLRILQNTSNSGALTSVPMSPRETKAFSWVADLGRIDPSAAEVDPDVLSCQPQKNLIAGRLELASGLIGSHRLAQSGDRVVPFAFKPIGGDSLGRGRPQALAEWIVAEIPIPECKVRLVEERFDSSSSRAMELTLEECGEDSVIEMAILNLPAASFQATAGNSMKHDEGVAKHFEIYYELSNKRPPNRLRPVPFVQDAQGIDPKVLRSPRDAKTILLDKILPDCARGVCSRPICPAVCFGCG